MFLHAQKAESSNALRKLAPCDEDERTRKLPNWLCSQNKLEFWNFTVDNPVFPL